MADFSYSNDQELKQLGAQVATKPGDFELWEKLVRAVEAQEGGLNRNSSPQAIAATREVYDRFLARFPPFFGYWKKYADLEFSIGGPEAAEMVYERGVASVNTSVDLWTNYCAFKVDTTHDPDVIRELFERGADSVGLDFHSHPFWDKYIEYEERMEDQTRIFAILDRIYRIPMHQYARYFERYRVMAAKRPVSELAREQVITVVTQEVRQTSGFGNSSGVEFEREMRARLDAIHLEIFKRTTDETLKRWTYESEIKRPYYHVNELDEAQLDNLRKYLDFEEAQGEYARIRFLYERCLVTAANYEEFWFRYARWTMSQTWMVKEVRDEAMRNICLRACALYVPIDQPGIRLYYARFEESVDKSGTAIAIHDAILANLPGHLETIVSLAGVHRRHDGVNSAIQFLEKYISNNDFSSEIRGSLVAEMARLIWKVKGDVREARAVFELRQQWFLDSPQFWTSWLFFEMEQPTSAEQETQCYEHIKLVFDTIHTSTSVPRATFKELTAHYFTYLQERGGRDAMKEFVELDKEIGRPESVTNPSVDNVGKEAVQSAMQNGERNIESN